MPLRVDRRFVRSSTYIYLEISSMYLLFFHVYSGGRRQRRGVPRCGGPSFLSHRPPIPPTLSPPFPSLFHDPAGIQQAQHTQRLAATVIFPPFYHPKTPPFAFHPAEREREKGLYTNTDAKIEAERRKTETREPTTTATNPSTTKSSSHRYSCILYTFSIYK